MESRKPSPLPLWALALALLSFHCGSDPGSNSPSSTSPSSTSEDAPGESSSPNLLDAPADDAGAGGKLAPLDIPDDAPTVVFLGDSIGAGLHLAEHQAFPALLQRRLHDAGQPFHLVSSCESGRTTAGGVTALSWVLRREPELVVIQLGGNDGLRGIELEEVEANLRKMIDAAKEAGAQVLLLGVRIPPNYGEYAADFDAIYPRLAKEYELPIVPFFMDGVGGIPEMNLEDGLHPTAAGHEKLADNVQQGFASALAAATARD